MNAPGERRARLLLLAVCVWLLASMAATGCSGCTDAGKMSACREMCRDRGVARFENVALVGMPNVEPRCVCGGESSDGGSR
jgi:hypothetical protein